MNACLVSPKYNLQQVKLFKNIYIHNGYSYNTDTSGPERVVYITGEPDQISIARDMIRQMVEDAKVTEANRSGATTAPPAGGYHHHHHHYGGAAGGNTMTIRIPVPKVGLVIGRGGETIREFEQQSRAKILLSSDSSNDINNERAITLLGDDAAIQHAKHLIEELVYGSPNVSFILLLERKKKTNLSV